MRGKTIFASVVTLSFLALFVFATFSTITIATSDQWGGSVVMALLVSTAVTCLWSLIIWLISPFIMDLVQRWAYKSRPISLEEIGQRRPAVAQFIYGVCQKHDVKVPALKLIDDMTPQAYCYGSYANNSRLVVTEGLFHYLDDEELKAVYGHELGHIIHRDFIVMTVAATLLSILWNTYVIARNIRGKNNSRPFMPIAVVAWIFWWLGTYFLLYLSRSREYYADEFAAAETGNPNALSSALVKVAYGITQHGASANSQKLLGGTRAMGISDFKMAASAGHSYGATQQPSPQQNPYAAPQQGYGQPQMAYAGYPQAYGQSPYTQPAAPAYAQAGAAAGVRAIEKVFLFDLFNPWGTVCELGSTHPLTGKRIRALCEQAKAMGQHPLFLFERIDAQGQQLDNARLYGGFFFELTIYALPTIFGILAGIAAGGLALMGQYQAAAMSAGGIVFGIGLGMTIRGLFRFPPMGEPQKSTVLELMSDAYASPLKGKPVLLEGQIIGKADAGGKLGEDMTLQDQSGGLIMLNYESLLGFLGNWWFGLKKVQALVGQPVQALGWFRRNVSQLVDLKTLRTHTETIESWTAFWGRAGGIVVLLIGALIAAGTAAATMM